MAKLFDGIMNDIRSRVGPGDSPLYELFVAVDILAQRVEKLEDRDAQP